MKNDLHFIAYKLWLYYHVQTEEFDKTLLYTHASPYDEGTVVPFGKSMSHSVTNAKGTRKLIGKIALYYGIADDIFSHEQSKLDKFSYTAIKRYFDELDGNNEFNFILKHKDEFESITRKPFTDNEIFRFH